MGKFEYGHLYVRNRPRVKAKIAYIAGTLEAKPILLVNKDVVWKCLIERVLPEIKEKWPSSSLKAIFIQQDNAKPHLDVKDADFVAAVREDGFDIHLSHQPLNNPDLNVVDLGFSRAINALQYKEVPKTAIDALQYKEVPKTIEEFTSAVKNAYEQFQVQHLNNIFLTLQACMVEVMRNAGGNNYKIPYMNKERLLQNGELPDCMECDSQILNEAKAML